MRGECIGKVAVGGAGHCPTRVVVVVDLTVVVVGAIVVVVGGIVVDVVVVVICKASSLLTRVCKLRTEVSNAVSRWLAVSALLLAVGCTTAIIPSANEATRNSMSTTHFQRSDSQPVSLGI